MKKTEKHIYIQTEKLMNQFYFNLLLSQGFDSVYLYQFSSM